MLDVDILGTNRQFDWIELSLVYGKCDKHTLIYDSYNVEMASKRIKLVRLTNFTKIYSLTNQKKDDIDNLMQKHSWRGAAMAQVSLLSVIICITPCIKN